MSLVFIIMMAVGLIAFAVSFFLPSDESAKEMPLVSEDKGTDKAKLKEAAETKQNETNSAIEAAKKKAREAVSGFDLHLNKDTSNQTVEELERDLLGDLDLTETEALAEAAEPAAETAPAPSKSSSKKGGKKKNQPKNDRYDDLLFESEPQTAEENPGQGANGGNNTKKNTKSGKNGKKGKKK